MPKLRVYVQVNTSRNRIFLRRYLDDCIVKDFNNDPKKMMTAIIVAAKWNNSKEGDNVTLRLIEHLRNIDQEYKIPKDFLPLKHPVLTEVVTK